jgi:hypothetical protein
MSFWDHFVLWVYLGLADTQPVGRDVAGRLFNNAFSLGFLVPGQLNDLSLLLVLAATPAGSPTHTAATVEINNRNLHAQPASAWNMLQALRPPRLAEWLEIGRPNDPTLRGLRAGILFRSPPLEVVANLRLFLGRLYLEDPANQTPRAYQIIVQAVNRFDRIPAGTVDFLCLLYQHGLLQLRPEDMPLPSVLPPGPRPGWYSALAPEEQTLINRGTASLPEPALVRFYLHFYARLTAGQIAGVLQVTDQTWTPDQVALDLEQSWLTVLS